MNGYANWGVHTLYPSKPESPEGPESLGEPRILGAPWPLRAALVVAVVGGPQLAIQLLAPEIRHLPGAFSAVALALTPVCLIAAFLLYLHWRLVGSAFTGMISICLALYGAHGFTMAGLWLTEDGGRPTVSLWEVLLNIVTVVALVAIVLKGERLLAVFDPLIFGIAAGLFVSVIDVVVVRVLPTVAPSDGLWALTHAIVLAVGVCVAALIVARNRTERWATMRLGVAIALLAVPRLTMTVAPESAVVTAAALTCGVLGAVLLCDTAISLLGGAVHEKMHAVGVLQDRIDSLDAERRGEQERLHEIRSTIAGIASASRLIRLRNGVTPSRRARLEEMLEAESRRLVRLVHDMPTEPTRGQVDLDSLIRPLVTAQQAQGRSVTWSPTGDHVNGDSDRLSEALSILLDNAAKHAPASSAEIEVRRDHGTVHLAVKDHGPGVARDMRDHVFTRGVKGASSRGQGLGLHLARRLVTESGSTLTLSDSEDGARFVIDLQEAHTRRFLSEGP